MSSVNVSQANQIDPEAEKQSAYRWVILLVCLFGFITKCMDENVWIPIIPVSKEALGFTMTQAGAYMSARAFGVLAAQIPGGILADRYGCKPVMTISLLCAALFSCLVGVTGDNFSTGIIFRFMTGMVVGPFYASAVKMVMSWFVLKERGTAMGFLQIGSATSLAIVNSYVPYVTAQYSWRVGFYTVTVLSLIAAALCYFLIKENPKALAAAAKKPKFQISQLKEIYLNPQLLLLILCVSFGAIWATGGVNEWTGSYIKKGLGYTNQQAGLIMAGLSIVAIACQPISGFLSDKMGGRRKPIVVVDLILFALFLMIVPFTTSMGSLRIVILMLGIVAFTYATPLNTLIPELAPPHLIASAVALQMIFISLGGLLRPLIIGKILDTGAPDVFLKAFMILAAGPVIGLVALLFIKEKKKEEIH